MKEEAAELVAAAGAMVEVADVKSTQQLNYWCCVKVQQLSLPEEC